MVNIDCGSYSPRGVNPIADLCEPRFRDADGTSSVAAMTRGRRAAARRPPDRRRQGPADPDPAGRAHGHRVRRRDGGRAPVLGSTETSRARPGVSDMKGGLLTGFFAMQVLQDAGFDGSDASPTCATRTRRSGRRSRGRSSGSWRRRTTSASCWRARAPTVTSCPRARAITDYDDRHRRARGARRRGAGEGAQRDAPGRRTRSWRCRSSTDAGPA